MDSQKGAAGTPGDITLLLIAASDGDRQAMDRALPLVYDLLRTQAARLIRRERSGHTLQPTALVHEVWLRLAGQHGARWEDRRHFCAVAATAMRRILVSHARFRRRLKRGGPRAGERVPVETLDAVVARLGLARIDFIKVDVEGAEASVVAGAAAVLSAMRPIMLIEINDKALRAQGNCAAGLVSTLQDELDYEIFVFSPITGLVERAEDNDPLSPNIVAIPRERVAETLTPV